MKIKFLVGFFLLLASASLTFAQSADESKILALENAWNAAQREHDNRALEPILADTFIDTEADGSVMNKGQFLAYVKDPQIKHTSLTSTELKVIMFDKSALVNGTYHDKGTEKGQPYDVHGRFTDTWVRMDGKWLCVASASTPLPQK